MSKSHANLLDRIDEVLAESDDASLVLDRTSTLIREGLEGYDWVGFYLVDPESPRELVLGPFAGADTDHRRIPFGRGICGQVAESEKTLVVDDVLAADNYLSCSANVRSEIVVPIMVDGEFVGQLDVDSHMPARFTGDDLRFCEAVCVKLAAGSVFRGRSR